MSEEIKNDILNLFGTDVDFSAIATDNIPLFDLQHIILEEKASFLLYKKEVFGKLYDYLTNNFNTKKHQENESYYSYYEDNLMYKGVESTLKLFGADTSIYGTIKNDNEKCRMIFPNNGEYCPKISQDIHDCAARSNEKFNTFFNPKSRDFLQEKTDNETPAGPSLNPWVPYWHEYTGDFKTIPISFRFNDKSGDGDMFICKTYGISNHRFIKTDYPLSFFKIKHNYYWAKIPRTDQQHLFNLDKIQKASTVIVCTTLEDAWALQNTNKTANEIAFTDFRCEEFEQVDFSPLKNKNIVFFVSNSNDNSLAERCVEIEELSSYLIDNKIIDKENVRFVLREIQYPSNEAIWDFKNLLTLYKQQPPMIKTDSLKLCTKQEFEKILKLAEAEIKRKETESADKPFYLSKSEEINDSNDVTEIKSIYDKMIIRPILYEGTVTVLSALAKTGKSRFTLKLCKLLVSKGSRESAITGMAIKKCYREHEPEKSAVYLAYDGNISGEIESIKKNDFNNSDLFIPIRADELSYLPKKDADALIEKIKEKSVHKNSGKPIPVGMIVIDTVRAFSGQDGNVDILKNVSNKLIEAFPQAAIMWLHHLNKEGKAAGGDEFTGVATININFTRDKNYANDNKKFIYSTIESNIQFSNEDAEATVCLTEDGEFKVVDPERTENEMVGKVYNYYTKKSKGKKKMSADEASRLLGYKDSSSIRKIKNKK